MQPDDQEVLYAVAEYTEPTSTPAVVAAETFRAAREEVAKVIVGQRSLLDRVLIAVVTGGHLLIEGVPGLAKTRTVKTFAHVLGGSWQRVQFTPDLVPADLTGTRIWTPGENRFVREIGPVATNFLLADEINRAPAKVQAALLESMEEHQVTIGRETIALPDPFVVLATQNPLESEGTYPLPDAQTDRFMFRVRVDYPTPLEELEILRRHLVSDHAAERVLDIDAVLDARRMVRDVYVPKDLAATIVELVDSTRNAGKVEPSLDGMLLCGAGPRGSLALMTASQGRAFLAGRSEATVDDIIDLAGDVLAHRIVLSYRAHESSLTQTEAVARLLQRAVGR